MSNIPLAREQLQAIIDRAPLTAVAIGLPAIMKLLTRESPVRKARKKIARLTPELAQRIREYAAANLEASQMEIAVHLGTNQGRVSEAMNHHA